MVYILCMTDCVLYDLVRLSCPVALVLTTKLTERGGKQDHLIDLRVWCPCPINVSLPPLR